MNESAHFARLRQQMVQQQLIARKVCSGERIPVLATGAQRKLQNLGCKNVHVTLGDGTIGCLAKLPLTR